MKAGIARSGRTTLAALTAALLVFSVVVVTSPGVAGAQGNPPSVECASDLWNGEYWKVQINDGSIGAVETSEPGAITLESDGSWTNNTDWDVFRIVMKVGQGVGDDVIHEPPVNPIDLTINGLSHVTFCFTDGEPEPDPGTIVVVKKVTEGSDQSQVFSFTESGFSLDDNTLAHDESGSASVAAGGDYSVAEDMPLPAGWSLQSAVCDSTDEADDSTPEDINVSSGETVTCTFTNHQTPPPPPDPGRIIVKKVVEGTETDQTFPFNPNYGEPFELAHGQENNSGDLDAGTYSVSERVPAGWTLVSATCDDQSSPSAISLQAGETVTCTFTNRRTPPPPPGNGFIIVKKVVTSGDTTQSFDFTANYDADGFSLKDGEQTAATPLSPGTYSVSETVPAGWTLQSATCSDGSLPSAIGLQEGETVTCTFTNLQDQVQASILVTVGGSCVTDNAGKGVGVIDVAVSVAGGATVVIKSGETVVATFTEDGSVSVPEGQTYTWEATANEGFEFPPGFVPSGSIVIEPCSVETLPLTGIESDWLLGMAILLLGSGAMLVFTGRKREES